APPPTGGPQPSDLLGASGDAAFLAWLNDFYARSLVAGWPRDVLDREFSGLSPDPRVTAHDATQPEFSRPVSDYVNASVTTAAVAIGRQKRRAIAQLPSIEQSYGVPRDILVAIWGM